MLYDGAKRIFTAALALCLIALAALCIEGDTLMGLNAEVNHPRQNDSLGIEVRDGVVTITGEGKLYGSDMHALVERLGDESDVTDLVIGDGITEIGYDAIVNYRGLRTLKLGKSVKTVDINSVHMCEALRYVYIPKGLARAGRDFLYGCNHCVVVTNGKAKDLPKLHNVKKDNLLTGIQSYEALAAALGDGEKLPAALKAWWE